MIIDVNPKECGPSTVPADNPPAYSSAGDNYSNQGHPAPLTKPTLPSTTVYHYVNPRTNEHVASLLSPDHPEMICLQAGGHVPQVKFGVLGILAAVFWFPLGIGLCLLDRRVKCSRCGYVIDDGICG